MTDEDINRWVDHIEPKSTRYHTTLSALDLTIIADTLRVSLCFGDSWRGLDTTSRRKTLDHVVGILACIRVPVP